MYVLLHRNKVNKLQLDKLVNFMVDHENLARGTYCNTAEGRTDSYRQWEDLKNQLNSLGPPTKTTSEWRRVSRNKLNFDLCIIIKKFFRSFGLFGNTEHELNYQKTKSV